MFASASFWIGLCALAGLALALTDVDFNGAYPIPDAWTKPAGVAMLSIAGLYLFACRHFERGQAPAWLRFELPRFSLALGQIALTAADLLAAALALYVLIPDDQLGLLAFAGIFCIAFLGGVISNAPDGIGVFETIFLLFLPTAASGMNSLPPCSCIGPSTFCYRS